jgi:hypothetical protein
MASTTGKRSLRKKGEGESGSPYFVLLIYGIVGEP